MVRILVVVVVVAMSLPAVLVPVFASPGSGLRIVDASDVTKTTPVVNEGGKLQLKVVDGSGDPVAVQSWSTDNKSVGKVNKKKGRLTGKAFGFATITAHTGQGDVSGFIVVARVRRQTGAMTQGDTKTDTGGNVYLSSPTRHVLYKASGLSAEVFAGHIDQGGYQDGTGDAIRFNGPAGIGVDNRAEGGLYIADTMNSVIRKVDFRERSSLAAGVPGFAGTMHGDENPIAEAVFDSPRGVASVGSNLFVTDTNNHCVWYVDVQRQVVELVAGEPGEAGNANGQGRAARFDHPSGITINTRGNLLAVADTGNNIVRLIAIAPRQGGGVIGNVTTLGLGSSARNADILAKLDTDRGSDQITFDAPVSVSFDGVDNAYVIDNKTASVVTRPSAASGRPVERVDLAQIGTLGDPASVTVRRTQAFVLNETPTSEQDALSVVEVGAPTITSVTPDTARLEGGTQVTITGTNFAPESKLTLGDAEVTDYTIETSTRITFSVPAQQAPGGRTLTITTRGGFAQMRFDVLAKSIADLQAGEITTIAGGVPYLGDGGSAAGARFRQPGALALDAAGNLLIADVSGYRLRRIDASTGQIRTVAGNGRNNYDGDGADALSASLGDPRGVAVDGQGNLLISVGGNRIRRVDATTGIITRFAGTGVVSPLGDGLLATEANLYLPSHLAANRAGDVFIADTYHQRVRKVDASSGRISTVAGNGQQQFSGDGGLGTNASLRYPKGIALDSMGNLFIADTQNSRIRRVDAASGIIETIAGSGQPVFGGDGGPATGASLNLPTGVAIDSTGDVFIADTGNNRVRRIDAGTGVITTIAGTGVAGYEGDGGPANRALLSSPADVVVDGFGVVYVSDTGSRRVRRIDTSNGLISTVAGSSDGETLGDGGPALRADISPFDVYSDEVGNLYIADILSNGVRRIDATSHLISTVAGNGVAGYSGDGGLATAASLNAPIGVAIDLEGNVFVVDGDNERVRRIDASTRTITTIAGNGGLGFSGDGGPGENSTLYYPADLDVDSSGNVYVADSENYRIRRIDAETGVITTVAGSGADDGGGDGGSALAASLVEPEGVGFDRSGSLLIADTYNSRVRRVDATTGTIATVAGIGVEGFAGDGGPATSAKLSLPFATAVDGAGNIFIAELARIRRVDAKTGIITTIAGVGIRAYFGDGGQATGAAIAFCHGLVVDGFGNLILADYDAQAIRLIKGVAVARK